VQLTLWGPNGEILDYARKQWAGLILPYYKQRWMLFEAMLIKSVTVQQKFDQNEYNSQVLLSVIEIVQ
jgi:alpha-N-acetylglucosaminidase